jgi:hypothetical protein
VKEDIKMVGTPETKAGSGEAGFGPSLPVGALSAKVITAAVAQLNENIGQRLARLSVNLRYDS